MNANFIENVRYSGFQPYREDTLVTKKPIQKNNYYKDFYNEISYDKKRKVNYFEKEPRWTSSYSNSIIGSLDQIKKENYLNKKLNPLSIY